MRPLLLFLSLAAICLSAIASAQNALETERSRLLSIPYQQRQEALQNSKVFDTNTVLGKYFYNSVHVHTPKHQPFFMLSQQERDFLSSKHPEYFYELQVQTLQMSDQAPSQIIAELENIRQQARSNHWPRIARWATAVLVEVLIEEGHYFSAVLNMLEISSHAPHVAQESVTYDYPLMFVYRDLAEAFYQARDYQKSHIYCQKYSNYLPGQMRTMTRGLICQARAEIKSGEFTSALRHSAKAIETAQNLNMPLELIMALRLMAETYLAKGNYPLAEAYALEALEYATSIEHPVVKDYFLNYAIITKSKISQRALPEARHYFNLMQQYANRSEQNAYLTRTEHQLNADIAYLDGNYPQAVNYYRELVTLTEKSSPVSMPWAELQELTQTLDDHQLSYLKIKAELDHAQTKHMTMLAVFTTALGLVGLIAFFRMFRQKRKIEAFSRLDHLTSVNNRWHAVQIIRRRLNTMARHTDVTCVALIDIDHFKTINDQYGHDAGDAVLVHIAKFFKYQLRSNDVFGRYGGEEFILMLEDTSLADARKKLHELHNLLESLPVPDMQITQLLRFSCGLAEVSGKADIDQVISYCDYLLYEAKRHGRNQTRAGCYVTCEEKKRA